MIRSRIPLFTGAAVLPLAALMICAATAAPARRTARKPAPAAKTVTSAPATLTFEKHVAPVLNRYCVSCHGAEEPAAGLNLQKYRTADTLTTSRKVWESIAQNVAQRHMPPPGMPQPTPVERERLVAWVETTLSQIDCKLEDPGRVTLRRLNRAEYNNTIRDLFGVDLRPADAFPSDDVGYGFDNIGDVLSLSPLLLEKYLTAAEKVSEAVIRAPENGLKTTVFRGGQINAGENVTSTDSGGKLLYTTARVFVEHDFPRDGEYTVRIDAWAQQAGDEPAKMALRLDGKDVRTFDVKAVEGKSQTYEATMPATSGKHRVALAFLNDYYDEKAPVGARDRNLAVEGLEIVPGKAAAGTAANLPPSHRRLIPRDPTPATANADAREFIGRFAQRAFRRPVTEQEVTRLVRYVDLARKQGESFERGMQLAVQAVLVSPNFLFRVELDPRPNDPKAKHALNDYEVASRLSYFLWSSMPDDTLFALAAKGRLRDPKVLAAQVQRMLKDPRADALTENFAVQWLTLRNLDTAAPDTKRYPQFSDGLRAAMRRESEMFFDHIVREDRPVLELIDARYTFLNETLARHYGNTDVKGEEFRKVALRSNQRGGVLTQASVLTVTSNPTRTSPVKRGKWVLEQIFGAPPPPPPPGAGELPDGEKAELSGTLRQRLEQHRSDPACASCHVRMDPIGFGLENFDAIGGWRADESGKPIDASGKLSDGRSFTGPAQLKTILLQQKDRFVHAFSEKMLTYALGRGVESYDRCNVDDIATFTAKNEYRFSALITAIVQSDPFLNRRGDGGPGTATKSAQAHGGKD